jgi:hypothetical protein
MSQDQFGTILAVMAVAAFAAVTAYVVTSSNDRLVRGVASLGLTEVPWWLLRAPRGRHVRPWRSLAPEPGRPAVAVGRARPVAPDPDPDFAAEVESFIAVLASPPVPDMEVRVAEILAHEEVHDRRDPAPERTGEGATAEWSPMADINVAPRPVPTLARTAPDAEELRLLAALDRVVHELNEVPEDMRDWARKVDASLEATKLNLDGHRRWRQQAFEVPTGEWRRDLILARP